MAKLKNRNEFIPGGFSYLQAETGWEAPRDLSFNGLVSAVQRHRRGNPFQANKHNWAMDYDSVADEVDTYNANRLKANQRYHRFILEGGEGSDFPVPKFLPRLAHVVAGASAGIKRTVAGVKTYISWLGEGGRTVEKKEAERRAAICVVCPMNEKGEWRHRFTEAAAAEILKVFGIMNDMKLHTSHDVDLGTCDACNCPLKSKVWAPLHHILKDIKPEVREALHPDCWITK